MSDGRLSGAAGLSVLLVDDDADTRELYEIALSRAGFDVFHARDAAEVFRQVAQGAPSVVVTDVRLPGIDGIEMLSRLRLATPTRELPVIVVTGWTDPTTRRRAATAGAAAFLLKPCLPNNLVSVVCQILGIDDAPGPER